MHSPVQFLILTGNTFCNLNVVNYSVYFMIDGSMVSIGTNKKEFTGLVEFETSSICFVLELFIRFIS